jgi:hypothetical protein
MAESEGEAAQMMGIRVMNDDAVQDRPKMCFSSKGFFKGGAQGRN